MGLNFGGIQVAVNSKVSQTAVCEFIQAFWVKIGAKVSAQDPLQLEPLSMERTGLLGFAILPKSKDKAGTSWIGIFDSQRYSADPALARALAIHFNTNVWFYEITDTVNSAYAKKYGPSEVEIRNYEKVIDRVDSFPGGGLYFNQIKDIPSADRKDMQFLALESVPYRSNAKYSGPSPERLSTNAEIPTVERAIAARDGHALLSYMTNRDIFYEHVQKEIENANPADPRDLEFLRILAPFDFHYKNCHCSVLEAALRLKDEALFEQGLALLPAYRVYTLERRALAIGQAEPWIAFRLLEAMSVKGCEFRTLNNTIHFLDKVVGREALPEKRLQALLEKALKAAPTNPSIFHNLACVYVKRKEYDLALQCVEGAVKYGYRQIDRLRKDEDLKDIWENPRFEKAFSDRTEGDFSWEHMTFSKTLRRFGVETSVPMMAPALGIHLYFKADKARTGAADLLDELNKEFPEIFTYCLPKGHIALSLTKKGRLTRTMNEFRKGKAAYRYEAYFNALDRGGACDRRITVDLMCQGRKHEWGEISLQLPLTLAENPAAVIDRVKRYVSMLPFEWGHVGYSLCVYYEGNGCDAEEDLLRLLESHIGLTTSQKTLHRLPKGEWLIPNWLTLLGPNWAEAAKATIKPLSDKKLVHTLPGGGVLIQAAERPFVGLGSPPKDLGHFPDVVRALQAFLPKDVPERDGFFTMQYQRLENIRMFYGDVPG